MKPKLLIARPIFQSVIDGLSKQFEVTSNQSDATWTPESWKQAIASHDAALTTGSDPINANVLGTQPRLKIAANMAVGFNNFDVPAMTSLGVQATNTPDVLTETTADFGFALMMATARRMTESEHFLRAGEWKQWRYDMFAGAEVHGSTLGILGMGRIGQGIARRGAHGFGMRVIYHNRSQLSAQQEAECKATYVSKEELLRTADHVVLVVPYSAESHHTIGAKEIGMMKPTATLVNIARGGIVDDAALAKALAAHQIAAAGLDVFEGEPALNPELLKLSNVVLTPHIASSTIQTRLAMAQLAADNITAYLTQGKPLTPLNQIPGKA